MVGIRVRFLSLNVAGFPEIILCSHTYEIFVCNINLAFLTFLYKIDIERFKSFNEK